VDIRSRVYDTIIVLNVQQTSTRPQIPQSSSIRDTAATSDAENTKVRRRQKKKEKKKREQGQTNDTAIGDNQ